MASGPWDKYTELLGGGSYPASRYKLILRDHGRGSVSSYGYDEKSASSGSMSPAGLAAALQAAGVKLDFIGFDTCAQKRRS